MQLINKKKYKATGVKQLFWFAEFRCMLRLCMQGKSLAEIQEQNKNQNIFGAISAERGDYILMTLWNRISGLPRQVIERFDHCDIVTQKQITLISIMISDMLFYEFMHDVVRDKFIVGDNSISAKDFGVFFSSKQRESELVASWKDYTLKKLSTTYRGYLADAGILDLKENTLKRPILDIDTETLLRDLSMQCYLNTLSGER